MITHNDLKIYLLTKKEDTNKFPLALNIDWLSDQEYSPIDWENTSVLVIEQGSNIKAQRLHNIPGFKTGSCMILYRVIHQDELITVYVYIKNGEYKMGHKIEDLICYETI